MKAGQLHVHSKASDGEVTPEMVGSAGLGFVAITDHDTLDGVAAFRPLAEMGVEVIAGVELTVSCAGCQAHVLVLAPEPKPGFASALQSLHDQRCQRVATVLEALEDAGVCMDKLDWQTHHVPTKWGITDAALDEPKNASLLLRMGITDARSFRRHFFGQSQIDYKIVGIPAEELFSLVDGIFILAHPARSFDLTCDGALVAGWLRAHPFAGLEVSTRKHHPDQAYLAAQLASECRLLAVTSNDAHTQSHLNANRTPAEQWAQLRQRASQG